MKGWLIFGAWRKPSVGGVSIGTTPVVLEMVVLRRSEVRGVEPDMVLLKERDSVAPFTFVDARGGSVLATEETDKLDLDNSRGNREQDLLVARPKSLKIWLEGCCP